MVEGGGGGVAPGRQLPGYLCGSHGGRVGAGVARGMRGSVLARSGAGGLRVCGGLRGGMRPLGGVEALRQLACSPVGERWRREGRERHCKRNKQAGRRAAEG